MNINTLLRKVLNLPLEIDDIKKYIGRPIWLVKSDSMIKLHHKLGIGEYIIISTKSNIIESSCDLPLILYNSIYHDEKYTDPLVLDIKDFGTKWLVYRKKKRKSKYSFIVYMMKKLNYIMDYVLYDILTNHSSTDDNYDWFDNENNI